MRLIDKKKLYAALLLFDCKLMRGMAYNLNGNKYRLSNLGYKNTEF
jgi:hypothetical protein